MTELKTLKDFVIWSRSESDPTGKIMEQTNNDLLKELKAEAVKWVKSYKRTLKSPKCLKENVILYKGSIGFIKKFFNLTEEDLEEKSE